MPTRVSPGAVSAAVSTRCEKCRAVCGQRRICVVCNKRICSRCASDWKKLKRKACIGLCARTAYARLKNPPRLVVTFIFDQARITRKGQNYGSAYPNTNPSQPDEAVRLP